MRAPPPLQIHGLDIAAMFLGDAITDAQTQAGSLAHGLGGIERIENTVRISEARSIVIKQHHHASIRRLALTVIFSGAGLPARQWNCSAGSAESA